MVAVAVIRNVILVIGQSLSMNGATAPKRGRAEVPLCAGPEDARGESVLRLVPLSRGLVGLPGIPMPDLDRPSGLIRFLLS